MVYGGLVVRCSRFDFRRLMILVRSAFSDAFINSALFVVSDRLTHLFRDSGEAALQQEIEQLLRDGIDQDTDATAVDQRRNDRGQISRWTDAKLPSHLANRSDRNPLWLRQSIVRLLSSESPSGSESYSGSRHEGYRQEIEQAVLHALVLGTAAAVLLAIAGTFLFRRQRE